MALSYLIYEKVLKKPETTARRSSGDQKEATDSMGKQWKRQLNGLSQEAFQKYKFAGIYDYQKGDYVSRGGVKLLDIIKSAGVQISGIVIDLGMGRGSWSQESCSGKDVTEVRGYTLGPEGHEVLQRFETLGHNLVTSSTGVDVFAKSPEKCDTILCDIESHPDPEDDEGFC